MRKFILLSVILMTGALSINGQQQSAIYDATAIMNAKYDLKVLLVPLPAGNSEAFELINPTGGTVDTVNNDQGLLDLDSTLKRNTNASGSRSVILEILRRNAGLPERSSENIIRAAYNDNPFLKDILSDPAPQIADKKILNKVRAYPASSQSGASVGANLLGNLVNGTADFLIKRAHEEISVSVIARLKRILELHPEFLKLFPRTCSLLDPIKPYEYSKALTAFKAAIREDMKSFIAHISSLYDIERYQLFNKKVPALSLVFTASSLLAELDGEKSFAACLGNIPSQPFMGENNNYTAIVRLLTLLSNSLLDQKLGDPVNNKVKYIDPLYISRVTHDDPLLIEFLSRIYLGLLWQRSKDINFITGTGSQPFSTFLVRWNNSRLFRDALGIVNKAVMTLSAAEQELREIKESEQETQKITGENHTIVRRFTSYATLISGALDMVVLFQDPASPARTRIFEIREYLPQFTTSVSSMMKNISEQEYNLAISSFEKTLIVLSDYLKTVEKNKSGAESLKNTVKAKIEVEIHSLDSLIAGLDSTIGTLRPSADPAIQLENEIQRQEYLVKKAILAEKREQLKQQKQRIKEIVFRLSRVISYVNLLAALTKAENSEAVERLLETYALPVGSSRIKKVTPFNIAVNSYVGGFFGRSGIPGSGFTNHYGLTAPIGFTFSTGFYKSGSASLFLSAFDIGGTVRYKLNNQGKYEQDITLAGIVSPGIHLVYGFPFYLPISAGFGYQWISPVTENTNKINLKSSFNAFIGVDIPLFNLTRSR